jgi:phage N-6-adenine-methyltransferase
MTARAMPLGQNPIAQRADWETPPAFFAKLDAEFGFTLDVCATPENAKCSRYFTPDDDGAVQDWGANICWMNPPYGIEIARWMRKAYSASKSGATVVCLVPSRTDAGWWHSYALRGEIRFIKGRLRFVGAPYNAAFPSAIVVFRKASPGDMRMACLGQYQTQTAAVAALR